MVKQLIRELEGLLEEMEVVRERSIEVENQVASVLKKLRKSGEKKVRIIHRTNPQLLKKEVYELIRKTLEDLSKEDAVQTLQLMRRTHQSEGMGPKSYDE